MKIRVEYREKFNVYGYTSPLINEASQEYEVNSLRTSYESKLKSNLDDGDSLSFVIWFVDEQHWHYHIGITKWDNFTEEATCVEVPAGYYAVGTVPAGVPDLTAWEQLLKTQLSAAGNIPVVEIVEQDTRKYIESYIDDAGNYEIWAPISDISKIKA